MNTKNNFKILLLVSVVVFSFGVASQASAYGIVKRQSKSVDAYVRQPLISQQIVPKVCTKLSAGYLCTNVAYKTPVVNPIIISTYLNTNTNTNTTTTTTTNAQPCDNMTNPGYANY